MAQQIKKKFIKNDAIDGSKIKLLEGQSIRIDGPAGEIELLKLGENGELLSDGREVAFKSQVDALQTAIEEEESRAKGVEEDLQSQITQEVSDRENAVSSESSRAMDVESDLQSQITSEVSRATSSEEALDSKIDQEISDRSQAMSAEESARISGDENLQNQINNILSNVDPEALDSLTEIVSAFQGADSDLQGAISALSTSAASALAQEVSDRQAADSDLQSSIDAEESRAQGEEQRIEDKFDGLVSAEESARQSADENLQSQIASEESAREAADQALQASIDAEEVARATADEILQASVDAEEAARIAADAVLQGNIDAEEARAMGVEASLQSQVTEEVADRVAGDASLDSRIVPMEEILEFNKAVIFENNAAVVADGQPGVEDAQLRDGWFYENMAAGEKINWYFFDGTSQANIEQQNFSAYAVVTLDKITTIPIMAVYTKPTGTNDFAPGFAHSRYIYSGLPAGTEVGKKYLMFIGEAPAIFPELPRLEIPLSSSQGDRLPTEEVFTVSLGTNSGAAVGSVKLIAEHLGVSSPSYKGNAELRIRPASLKKLEDEIALRQSSQSSIEQSITDLEGVVQGNFDLQQSDIDLIRSDIDALTSTDASLQSQIDAEKSRLDAILDASDADKDSFKEIVDLINSVDTENDQAFAGYVLSNNAALAQEVSDRESGDAATLVSANEYTDAQIAAIPAVDLSGVESDIDSLESRMDTAEGGIVSLESRTATAESDIDSLEARVTESESDITTLQSQVLNVESEVSSLEARMTTAESDVDSLEAALASEVSRATSAEGSLDSRIETLETAPVTRVVEDEKHSVMSTLTHVMLDFKAEKIFKVVVGRVNAMKGEDYVVSEEGGKTKLTWIGSFAEGGVEALESGDSVFCTYSTFESVTPDEGGTPEPEPEPELVSLVLRIYAFNNSGEVYFEGTSEDFDKIVVGRDANVSLTGLGVTALPVLSKIIPNPGFIIVTFGYSANNLPDYPSNVEFFVDA